MPRQARLDAPGTLHHVIVRGIEKQRIVQHHKDRQDFVFRMGEVAMETDTKIYAWSLMSNHAHILLRSADAGLPRYMRRFLTGYAVSYNRRHLRHGHLFQNRYKSIVCEEDAYFMELVRYIHLNPLRAKLVKDLGGLGKYPWCGHGVILGKYKNKWQDRDDVLRWFGKREKEAVGRYRRYMKEGIGRGRRPDLVGGGLIRSQGGWSEVMSMRRHGDRELSDERILGSGGFVEGVLRDADERVKHQFESRKGLEAIEEYVRRRCEEEGVGVEELRSGSRRRLVSRVRLELGLELTKKYGVTIAEVARQTGVSTSAISRRLRDVKNITHKNQERPLHK